MYFVNWPLWPGDLIWPVIEGDTIVGNLELVGTSVFVRTFQRVQLDNWSLPHARGNTPIFVPAFK